MKPCSFLFFVTVVAALSVMECAIAQVDSLVRITEVNLSTRSVELTNFGSAPVDFSSWFFCHSFNYISRPSGTIAPGQSRQFTVANLNQTASDLGLYRDGNFFDPAKMEDFIQWGSGGHGRQPEAVMKGIWTTGTFLPLPPSGKSFHARGLSTTGLRATNWFVGWPHAGFPVPDVAFESIVFTGSEWRVIAQSFYLTDAHRADVRSDLSSVWQEIVAPTIAELGNGRIDVRFPATGMRQFTRVRAEF